MPAALPAESSVIKRLSPTHLGYLDGIRGLAAVFVLVHHIWYEIWPAARATAPPWTAVLYYGHLAVDVFIVLSGFCLMLPIVRGDGNLRGGTLKFFKKRAVRILPPYYAALALSLLLISALIGKPTGTHWDYSLPVTPRSALIHLLLLQNFSAHQVFKINHAFWSISLEWWIYFLFPALIFAWKRFGAVLTAVLSIAASYVLVSVCQQQFHESFTLQYIALFAVGMLGCEIAHGHRPALRRVQQQVPWEGLSWIAAGLSVLALSGNLPHFRLQERSDLLVGLWATCLLISISLHRATLLCRIVSHRTLVFLGSFAYSIYLIHAPLIQVIWQYLLYPLHLSPVPAFLVLECAGLPLIITVSYFFHLAFERPFMSQPGTRAKNEAQAAALLSPAP